MNKDDQSLAVKAAIVIGVYFIAVRPIINLFSGDQATKDTLDSVVDAPNSDNPFSPYFGLDYSKANGGANSSFLNSDFNYIQNNAHSDNVMDKDYARLAEQVYRAMGYFWISSDDVDGAFAQVTSQYEVSQMAQFLLWRYQVDLYQWLKKGQALSSYLDNGIGDAALARIVTHIRTLPVF